MRFRYASLPFTAVLAAALAAPAQAHAAFTDDVGDFVSDNITYLIAGLAVEHIEAGK